MLSYIQGNHHLLCSWVFSIYLLSYVQLKNTAQVNPALRRKITSGTDMENMAQLKNHRLAGIYSLTCSFTLRLLEFCIANLFGISEGRVSQMVITWITFKSK